jgi:hypothetical protein
MYPESYNNPILRSILHNFTHFVKKNIKFIWKQTLLKKTSYCAVWRIWGEYFASVAVAKAGHRMRAEPTRGAMERA